jgi:predicted RNA-binding protein YlxR (DUF448 family)
MRIVRLPGSIQVDPSGKLTGRGAYLHNRRSCWEIGLKGALEKALKTEFTDIDREYLLNIMATLPEEAPTREVEHDE